MDNTCMDAQTTNQGTGSTSCCGDIASLISPRLFKALGDPRRVALLAELCQNGEPTTVTGVSHCCPTDLSVVSRPLAILREAGIVSSEKRGREVFYSVRYAELAATLRAVAEAIEACCLPAPALMGETGS